MARSAEAFARRRAKVGTAAVSTSSSGTAHLSSVAPGTAVTSSATSDSVCGSAPCAAPGVRSSELSRGSAPLAAQDFLATTTVSATPASSAASGTALTSPATFDPVCGSAPCAALGVRSSALSRGSAPLAGQDFLETSSASATSALVGGFAPLAVQGACSSAASSGGSLFDPAAFAASSSMCGSALPACGLAPSAVVGSSAASSSVFSHNVMLFFGTLPLNVSASILPRDWCGSLG